MSAYVLPTLTDGETPFYRFNLELDGVVYQFDFYWNNRRERWTFDLTAIDGEIIIAGQTVHPYTNLLRRSVSAQKPPGILICLPENYNGDLYAPTLIDLGNSYKLTYYTEDDELFEDS